MTRPWAQGTLPRGHYRITARSRSRSRSRRHRRRWKCAVHAKRVFMPLTDLRHKCLLEPICRVPLQLKTSQTALLALMAPHFAHPLVNIRGVLIQAQQRAHVAKEKETMSTIANGCGEDRWIRSRVRGGAPRIHGLRGVWLDRAPRILAVLL